MSLPPRPLVKPSEALSRRFVFGPEGPSGSDGERPLPGLDAGLIDAVLWEPGAGGTPEARGEPLRPAPGPAPEGFDALRPGSGTAGAAAIPVPVATPSPPPDGWAPAAHADAGLERRHGFTIGELGLLHDPADRVELIDPVPVFELPLTRGWLAGLINVRGNLVPVFDLRRLPGAGGVPEAAEEAGRAGGRDETMFMVFGQGERAAALRIDGVPRLVRIDPGGLRPDPGLAPELVARCVRGVHEVDGEPWLEVDYASMFATLATNAEA